MKLNQDKTELVVPSSKFRNRPNLEYVRDRDKFIAPKSFVHLKVYFFNTQRSTGNFASLRSAQQSLLKEIYNCLSSAYRWYQHGQILKFMVARLNPKYLTSLRIHFVSINKVIGKKLPQLYCIMITNSYDSCFIEIGVSMAT